MNHQVSALLKPVIYRDAGLMAYRDAWALQEELFAETIAVKMANRERPESAQQIPQHHLILCEHPPVITLGKNAKWNNLLVDDDNERGVEIVPINRGGDVTFHGPGQLVGYPILDLDQFYTDIGLYLRNLEEVIIRTLAQYQIQASRLKGATGVWLDPDDPFKARKICAMGIRCSRWVTMHGFALNVHTDMTYFNMIIPCGIGDKAVTSMQQELRRPISMDEVKQHFLKHFSEVFQCQLVYEK